MDPKLRRAYSRCVVEVSRGLLPDLVNGYYDYLIIDLASITYGVNDPRSFLVNMRLAIDYGYLEPRVLFVLDYSKPEHRGVAGSRIKWLRDLGLEYVLAENEPAEVRAARLCLERPRCIVLSRDYDPLTIINEMLQPIKVSERAWVLRKIAINRDCLAKHGIP
jgi:hypothetical protein